MRDLFFITGILLLAAGAWWLSPPWALVSVGGVLLIGGVAGHFVGRRKNDPR